MPSEIRGRFSAGGAEPFNQKGSGCTLGLGRLFGLGLAARVGFIATLPAKAGSAHESGFAQLTTSRSRLARTRHHRRQSSVTSEFGDVTEFRCPGPTPSDAASPVCPSRHHKAGYGQLPPGSQRMPLSRLPFKRTATTISSHHDMHITPPHHRTLHRTHRPTRRA